MITTKKIIASATLALAMLGLTTSLPAYADGASDAATYCTGCHDGLTVESAAGTPLGVVAGGARNCPQRTVAEWTSTIDRMNGKGCSVPAGSIAGIANYLASLPPMATSSSTLSTTSTSTTTSTTSTTTSSTLPPTANDYDMGIAVTASSTYLLSNALDSYGVSYSATVTNFGPSTGVADVHLQMFPDRVWSGSLSANCVRYLDGCRATLAAGEQATITFSSYVRLDSSLSLTLSIEDVVSDIAFETNSGNNTATVSFVPPVPPPTTTTCYDTYGNPFTVSGWCPLGSTANPPPTCASGTSPYLGYVGGGVWSWSCEATTTTSTTTSTTTTSTTSTTQPPTLVCYYGDGTSLTTSASSCPAGSSTTPPPSCPNYEPAQLVSGTWVCPLPPGACFNSSGAIVTYAFLCPAGTLHTPPPTCSGGLPTIEGEVWVCPTATTSTTTTTVTTTTTTLCDTYVNGTTQYPYSGSGSCHGHPDNDSSSGHVVRDQKWCRKHMTHFNSSGNHTHAYPHPLCM